MKSFLLISVILLISCGGEPSLKKPIKNEQAPLIEENKPPSQQTTLDVMAYDIDNLDFSKLKKTEKTEVIDSVETEMVRKQMKGWRIQIGTFKEYERATNLEEEVTRQLIDSPHKVYKDFYSPNYRIKVGDFKNRAEAIKVLREMKDLGYRDAWPVSDKIFVFEEEILTESNETIDQNN